MSTRKIIDPKQNGEKVWLKGHAQATFMSDGSTVEQQIAGKMDKVTLAPIATSGNYDDLSNKPTIPNAVTESTVSGWGFTKNTGTYSKPSTGIPKSDLASDILTSLDKANTALLSYTEQYKGTVTGVKINGSTKSPSSGVVDLGTVITSHQDISGKQDKLVSSTNIKTINGESILGEGNLTVTTEANIQAVDTTDEIEDVETNTYVKYVALTLTDELKALVRENIGISNDVSSNETSGILELVSIKSTSAYAVAKPGISVTANVYTSVKYPVEEDLTVTFNYKNSVNIENLKSLTINAGNTESGFEELDILSNTFSIIDITPAQIGNTIYIPDNFNPTETVSKVNNIETQIGDINTILESIINGGNPNNLITFTVDGKECQAEEGMDWEDFINSQYNDDKFTYSGDYVWYNNTYLLLYGGFITTGDMILANASYSTGYGGGL